MDIILTVIHFKRVRSALMYKTEMRLKQEQQVLVGLIFRIVEYSELPLLGHLSSNQKTSLERLNLLKIVFSFFITELATFMKGRLLHDNN